MYYRPTPIIRYGLNCDTGEITKEIRGKKYIIEDIVHPNISSVYAKVNTEITLDSAINILKQNIKYHPIFHYSMIYLIQYILELYKCVLHINPKVYI
jgi:hypothetical protein